jgi:selenocysteine lyase/cysteine desulfurase
MLLNKSREYLAKRINCKVQNLFLVQNATDAFNCLAKSMVWKAGETIAIPNTAYACVRKTV